MEFKNNILKLGIFILLWSFAALAQTGPEKVRRLVDLLENESDYKVRIGAAQTLGQIADGTVADWMLRTFRKDGNDAVRLSILYAISQIPDERILPPLIELAHQEVLSDRELVLIQQILWNSAEAFHKPAWITESLGGDAEMKRISIWLLGIIGDDDLIPLFQKLLDSSDESIQAQTFESLSWLHSSRALELCRSKLQNPLASRAKRAAQNCERVNALSAQQKLSQDRTFRKKLPDRPESMKNHSIKPSHYLAYLDKTMNEREVDQALHFLVPSSSASTSDKTVKLMERERIRTFQLVVDLVSKYEFDDKDLEILKTIIRENSGPLDVCYLNGLRENPKLKGDVEVSFKILKSGAVDEIRIAKSSLKNPDVEECILNELDKFEFPSLPVDNVNLAYTFMFTPPAETQIIFKR